MTRSGHSRVVASAAFAAVIVSAVARAGFAAGAGADEPAGGTRFAGAGTCLMCHDARADFSGNVHAKAWPKAKGIAFERSCETCHGPGSLHAEAGGDRDDPGFATVGSGAAIAASCLGCHEDRERAHWRGSTHEGRGVGCTDCHQVHAGQDHPSLLAEPGVLETCLACHADVGVQAAKASHHPVREGAMTCTDCHNPHGSVGPGLLKQAGVNEQCYTCHAEKRGPFLFEHRPAAEDCTVCHAPHGSNNARMLVQRLPLLCQSCHSNSRHPGTMYAVDPSPPSGNTFEELNNRALYRGCVNCHAQVHGTNHPSGKTLLR